jgi:hypothetical protein
MTIGFDRDLYVLPFDHRGSVETKMFGWEWPVTADVTHDHFSAPQGLEGDHTNILWMGGLTVGPVVA